MRVHANTTPKAPLPILRTTVKSSMRVVLARGATTTALSTKGYGLAVIARHVTGCQLAEMVQHCVGGRGGQYLPSPTTGALT